jgi:AbrB family looped-hinge helix DNA binding protein
MLIDSGEAMETVTVSPKYQVVIPSRVRRLLGVKPGQKVKVILYDNRIEMIPVKPVEEARGFLKGIDTTIERESDRL